MTECHDILLIIKQPRISLTVPHHNVGKNKDNHVTAAETHRFNSLSKRGHNCTNHVIATGGQHHVNVNNLSEPVDIVSEGGHTP